MSNKPKKTESEFTRREFLKIGGAVAAGLQVGAVAGAGLAAGRDPSTNTGWQHLGDNTQFFNRKKFVMKGPAWEVVGETSRPAMVESPFGRQGLMMRDMMEYRRMLESIDAGEERQEGMGERAQLARETAPETTGAVSPGHRSPSAFPPIEAFKEPLLTWYKTYPEQYELDKYRMEEIMPKKQEDSKKYRDYYTLINAWSNSWSTNERITEPPEESDFKIGRRRIGRAMPFKSPTHASKLIKKVAHHFGATMVGITTIEPDWCYD